MSKENKDIQKVIKDTTKAILADETFLTMIVKSVSDHLASKLDETLGKKLDVYDKRISALEEENEKLKYQLNLQDQYNRRNCIRIFGVEESDSENLDDIVNNLFNKTMKLKLNSITSIENCFRIGKRPMLRDTETDNAVTRSATKTTNKPRAILVKFANYKERQKVIDTRKILKSSGIVIREDLAKSKMELLKIAIRKYTSRNIWTRDGNIYLNLNGRRTIINSEKDL